MKHNLYLFNQVQIALVQIVWKAHSWFCLGKKVWEFSLKNNDILSFLPFTWLFDMLRRMELGWRRKSWGTSRLQKQPLQSGSPACPLYILQNKLDPNHQNVLSMVWISWSIIPANCSYQTFFLLSINLGFSGVFF